MNKVKSFGAGILLLLSFWCLGRAIETGLDRDPTRVGKRETVIAGVLLGVPTGVGGSWLLWQARRDRQLAEEKQLRDTFFQLVKAGRGKITPLRFSMEAQINGDQAKAYLDQRSREFDATFEVNAEGHITYCFYLDEVEKQRYRPAPPHRFDIILEAVPGLQQHEVVQTLQQLTGLDGEAVRHLVQDIPRPIQRRASKATAAKFQQALEAVGAQVTLVQSDRPLPR